jgi:hypothetical protein
MLDPANWYEWIKVSAFVAGIVFGGFAVGSPSWVWLTKQLMPAVAGYLATLGVVLISMSIWQSVEIEGPGLRLKMAELAEALALQSDVIRANAKLTLAEPPRRLGGVMGAEVKNDEEESSAFDYSLKREALETAVPSRVVV